MHGNVLWLHHVDAMEMGESEYTRGASNETPKKIIAGQ
jgi:hypothetical protein